MVLRWGTAVLLILGTPKQSLTELQSALPNLAVAFKAAAAGDHFGVLGMDILLGHGLHRGGGVIQAPLLTWHPGQAPLLPTPS